MKKLSVAMLFALSGQLNQLAIAQQNGQNVMHERIKDVINNYEQAWNRHDAKALAEQYHTDATWVNWFGAYYKGRPDIEKHYQSTHSTYFKATHFTTRLIEDITMVKPDMALVHVRTDLSGDEHYPGQTFRFRRTIILTNKEGGWRILTGQNAKLNEGID